MTASINTPDRAAMAGAFRAAKAFLYRGKGRLGDRKLAICHALSQAYSKGTIAAAAANAARRLVMARLQGHAYLGDWLCDKHGIRAPVHCAKLQRTRHAWLDSLIKEFSA